MAQNGGGEFIENVISFLIIIFFIFGGFFKKKDKKPQGKKKPYKPLFPPMDAEDSETSRRQTVFQPKQKAMPEYQRRAQKKGHKSLKGVFAEVLDQLEEAAHAETSRKSTPVAPSTSIPKVWDGTRRPSVETPPKKPVKVTVQDISPERRERLEMIKKERATGKAFATDSEKRARREAKAARRQRKKRTALRLDSLLTQNGLKSAVIMSEVLGKPIALREQNRNY